MPPNERTVFYSWQSDLPSKTNRGLIRDALDKAVESLSETIDEVVRADSDTQGVGGVRDIHQVILDKLDRCDAAVFDVTPVAQNGERKLPNPNVMLELGYGLARPGIERLVLVLNTAHARVEELPFDIRNRPVKTYSMVETDAPANARNELASKLKDALQAILRAARAPEVSKAERVVAAIRAGAPDKGVQLDEFYATLPDDLRSRRPAWSEADWDQKVLGAYGDALPVTRDFASVTSIAVRLIEPADLLPKLTSLFEQLFGRARRNREEAVRNERAEMHDFENLMVREMFVVAIDCFLAAGKFAALNDFFEVEYHVEDGIRPYTGQFAAVMAAGNTAVVKWAEREPPSANQTWKSPLGELHRRRFTSDEGAAVVAYERFRAAELVAFHRSGRQPGSGFQKSWYACCLPYATFGPPKFFEDARTRRGAEALAMVLGFGSDLDGLKSFWSQARRTLVERWLQHMVEPEWLEASEIAGR